MRNFSVVVFSWQLSRSFFLSELTCNKVFLFIYYILTLIKHRAQDTAQLSVCLWFFFPRGASPWLQFHSCLHSFYIFPLRFLSCCPSFITSKCSFGLLNKLLKFVVATIGPSEKCEIYYHWIFSIMKHNKVFTPLHN